MMIDAEIVEGVNAVPLVERLLADPRAVYLHAHHPDIYRFLDTKRENADEKIRIKTLSLGVVIPDITFELAKNNGCLSCHSAKEKIVGPAYSDVADKYRGDKDAVANLVQSIQYGSKGKWGRVPMPPHPGMSAADIKTLAQWVMTAQH